MPLITKLIYWFAANAILPILLPVLCVAGYDWFVQDDAGVADFLPQCWRVFLTFTSQGYYIFSALTLVLSLFENFDDLKRCTTIKDGVFLTLLGGLTMIVFYRQYQDANFMQCHLWKFIVIWLFLAVYAFKLKMGLLSVQKRSKQRKLWNLTTS